jgi:peptidoglycan/LPS O-acetylase OafA/YrhL
MLSGFLITTLLIKEYIRHRNINIKNFFIKRALRIFPVFYLYLIAVFLINKFFHLNLIVDHFLGPMLYINNFNFFKTTWLTGHTWSLAVEEQFYLIFPFVFSHASNKLWAFCVGIILLTQFIRIFCYLKPEYENILLFPFLGYAEAIFVGALLSIASFKGLFNSEQRLWSNKKLVPIGIFIIIMIYYFTSRGIFGVFLLPFGSITLNLFIGFLLLQSILNKNTVIYRFLNLNFMINIGLISYSLYIWQQLFMIPLNVYPDLKNWPVFPFNILFSFLMAYISYHFFEKFFLKMKGKFITNPI